MPAGGLWVNSGGKSTPVGQQFWLKPLPAHLSREDVNCDLAAAEQKCSGGDQSMKFLGDAPTERLELTGIG